MSALDELKKKNPIDMTMLEFVVTQAEYSEITGNAEHAAQELADKDAELLALRERVAKVDKALTRCITFLTNVNTITDDSQIELVKELIDAGRTDLADAVSIGGFGSAL